MNTTMDYNATTSTDMFFTVQEMRQIKVLHVVASSFGIALLLFVFFSMALFRIRVFRKSNFSSVNLMLSLFLQNAFSLLAGAGGLDEGFFNNHKNLCYFQGGGKFLFYTSTYVWTLAVMFQRCCSDVVSTIDKVAYLPTFHSFVNVTFPMRKKLKHAAFYASIIFAWGVPLTLFAVAVGLDLIEFTPLRFVTILLFRILSQNVV